MRSYPVRCASAEWRHERPLVDIERDTRPLEWAAAKYEWYAASTARADAPSSSYCAAALNVVEQLEDVHAAT